MLNTSSTTKLPATELYLIANNRLTPEFQMTERSLIFVIGHSIAVGVQSMLRVNLDRAYAAAKRNGIPFYLVLSGAGGGPAGQGRFRSRIHEGPVPGGRCPRTGRPPVRPGDERSPARVAFAGEIARNGSGGRGYRKLFSAPVGNHFNLGKLKDSGALLVP